MIGTELLIDTLLTKLGHADDERKEWPADATKNKLLRRHLSYSKMVNEINHRELRKKDKNGVV